MPRATARRILVSDDENPPELEALLAAAAPGKPGRGPAEPAEPPREPVPIPGSPDDNPAEPDPDEEDPDEPDEDPEDPEDPDEDENAAADGQDEPQAATAVATFPVAQSAPAPLNVAVGQATGIEGEILGEIRYESRITILDAWQYPGALRAAPKWVDRNWAGYGDHDPVRNIEPGPCLRVPSTANPAEAVLCRIGDYVARQSVTITDHLTDVRIEVWAREQFEKLFIPRNH